MSLWRLLLLVPGGCGASRGRYSLSVIIFISMLMRTLFLMGSVFIPSDRRKRHHALFVFPGLPSNERSRLQDGGQSCSSFRSGEEAMSSGPHTKAGIEPTTPRLLAGSSLVLSHQDLRHRPTFPGILSSRRLLKGGAEAQRGRNICSHQKLRLRMSCTRGAENLDTMLPP